MGSLLSPRVVNIFVEFFEEYVVGNVLRPLQIWRGYVDDTFVIIKRDYWDAYLDYMFSVQPQAEPQTGIIPFLENIIYREARAESFPQRGTESQPQLGTTSTSTPVILSPQKAPSSMDYF